MTTYITEIDEEQRGIFIKALKALPGKTEDEQLLLEMMEGLPEIEEKTPGIIHGLCF